MDLSAECCYVHWSVVLLIRLSSVLQAGGEASEGRAPAPAAETWQSDERDDWPVRRERQRTAAAAGERRGRVLLGGGGSFLFYGCDDLMCVCVCAEWEVSPADRERDAAAKVSGWTAQPSDEGLERSAEEPQEGLNDPWHHTFVSNAAQVFFQLFAVNDSTLYSIQYDVSYLLTGSGGWTEPEEKRTRAFLQDEWGTRGSDPRLTNQTHQVSSVPRFLQHMNHCVHPPARPPTLSRPNLWETKGLTAVRNSLPSWGFNAV